MAGEFNTMHGGGIKRFDVGGIMGGQHAEMHHRLWIWPRMRAPGSC